MGEEVYSSTCIIYTLYREYQKRKLEAEELGRKIRILRSVLSGEEPTAAATSALGLASGPNLVTIR